MHALTTSQADGPTQRKRCGRRLENEYASPGPKIFCSSSTAEDLHLRNGLAVHDGTLTSKPAATARGLPFVDLADLAA